MLSLHKYEQENSDPDTNDPFNDSLNALVFEMNNMITGTAIGQGLVTSICSNFPTNAGDKMKGKIMFTPLVCT